jgi:hypothetical protein
LAQGIAEFGRIDKTLHSLRFIDDKDMRRGTLTQLNRGEGRHSVARVVFSGKRGELRQRYREGQEDQLGALGLVVNMIVLAPIECLIILHSQRTNLLFGLWIERVFLLGKGWQSKADCQSYKGNY